MKLYEFYFKSSEEIVRVNVLTQSEHTAVTLFSFFYVRFNFDKFQQKVEGDLYYDWIV